MTDQRHPAPTVPFIIALLAAPSLILLVLLGFGQLGEYGSRYGQAGAAGFLLALPAWLTVFSVLALRGARRGRVATRDHVLMALYANAASIVIFPVVVVLADLAGAGIRETLAANMGDDEPPSPLVAGLFAGGASFFLGLFFMPTMAWIFSTVGRALGGLSRNAKV